MTFCVACGDDDPTHLEHHHLKPRSRGGTDDEKNMIALCGTCHGELHGYDRVNNLSTLIREGMSKARDNGKAIGRPKISAEKDEAIRRLLATGMGMGKVARTVGVGIATVQRIKYSRSKP
jgi:hypothetical protein